MRLSSWGALLLLVTGAAGCSAQIEDDQDVRQTTQALETNGHYYLRCNATGWSVDDTSRLVATGDSERTLTFEVSQPWMLNGDTCNLMRTDQLNGWGSTQESYATSNSPVSAPGTHSVTTGYSFNVQYPALGTYTATLNTTNDTLSIVAGSGSGGSECGYSEGTTTPPAVATRENTDGFFVPPANEAFVLPAGAATSWQYTSQKPGNDWTQSWFNDSSWQSGAAGFFAGSMPGDAANTPWPNGASDLWLRASFDAQECDLDQLVFWGRWDDTIEIYINGVLANERDSWSNAYRYLGLKAEARDALVVGENTIAVHVHDLGGGKYFDLGVLRHSEMSERVEDGYAQNSVVNEFAEITKAFMIDNGIPSGTLAVMKQDQIVLSKAFGHADKYFTQPLQEGAVMRLASNDKVISLATVQDLIDRDTFDPVSNQFITRDTLVYPLLVAHGLEPAPGITVPANSPVNDVTLGMLLTHQSGLSELPSPETIAAAFGIATDALNAEHNIRWMYSAPVGFTPGSDERYCSSCYMLARHVVTVLTGDLIDHIQNVTLSPASEAGVFLSAERLADRQASEPWYVTFEAPYARWTNLENYTALSATAPGLVRMLRKYHLGTGTKLIDPNTGEWAAVPDNGGGIFWGGMAGTSSMTLQRRWDEVNIAFVFNLVGSYDALYQQLNAHVNSMSESDWGI